MKKLLAALVALMAGSGAYAACPVGSTCQTFSAFTSGVSSASALGGTELFPCIQSAATVSCTPAQLWTYISGKLVSPPAIGGTTPAAGSFTTLSSTGVLSNSVAGAASASAVSVTGAPYTGGTGTTTFPLAYIDAGTGPTTFSTNGTEFGINAPSGFTGNFFDNYVNGAEAAYEDANGSWAIYNFNLTSTAPPEPQLHPIISSANVNNSFNIGAGAYNIGSPSGTSVCTTNDLSGSPTASSWYFVTLEYIGGDGDFLFCSGAGAPIYEFHALATATNTVDILQLTNDGGHGPKFTVATNGSTICAGSPTAASYAGPCNSIWTDQAASSTYPLQILERFSGSHAIDWIQHNLRWFLVGDTTPVRAVTLTSAAGTDAQVVVGDASQTTSTATLQADGISLVASNAALTETGITTGTNADFVCLSSGGVFLLQSSACTISSLRFKSHVDPFTGDALSELDRLQVDSYQLNGKNADPNAGLTQIGLIAENIAQVEPRCAIYENDLKTPKSYRPECITALLVSADQEFHRESRNQFYLIYALIGALLLTMGHSAHLHFRLKTSAA